MLTDEQVERFSRQIILPEVGARGQQRLLMASVLIVGEGDAASQCALALERAGVGCVRLVKTAPVESDWQDVDLMLRITGDMPHESPLVPPATVPVNEWTIARSASSGTPLLFVTTDSNGIVRLGATPPPVVHRGPPRTTALSAACISFLAAEAALTCLRFLLGLGSLPEEVEFDLFTGNFGTTISL